VLSPRAADLQRLAGNMPQTLSFRKKRYTDADCSLVLALLNGEHGLRGRGSGHCSGAACGGRAVGWACVPHIDCLVHDSALRGEGISPTPRREVAATHEEWSRGGALPGFSQGVATPCIPGAPAIRPAAPPGWQLDPIVWG
jgi:hypothetical protein